VSIYTHFRAHPRKIWKVAGLRVFSGLPETTGNPNLEGMLGSVFLGQGADLGPGT
jgi:hypothetical protein